MPDSLGCKIKSSAVFMSRFNGPTGSRTMSTHLPQCPIVELIFFFFWFFIRVCPLCFPQSWVIKVLRLSTCWRSCSRQRDLSHLVAYVQLGLEMQFECKVLDSFSKKLKNYPFWQMGIKRFRYGLIRHLSYFTIILNAMRLKVLKHFKA